MKPKKYVIAEWTTGEYPYEVFEENSRNRICANCTKADAEKLADLLNKDLLKVNYFRKKNI